jgi:hypothetical protein
MSVQGLVEAIETEAEAEATALSTAPTRRRARS